MHLQDKSKYREHMHNDKSKYREHMHNGRPSGTINLSLSPFFLSTHLSCIMYVVATCWWRGVAGSWQNVLLSYSKMHIFSQTDMFLIWTLFDDRGVAGSWQNQLLSYSKMHISSETDWTVLNFAGRGQDNLLVVCCHVVITSIRASVGSLTFLTSAYFRFPRR